MVLESPSKYLKCQCGGSLILFEQNRNMLLYENGDKRVQLFAYRCKRCGLRVYRSYDEAPDDESRAMWALEEAHLQETGEVQPF